MYYIKDDVKLEDLRKYGFLLGKELPEANRLLPNYEREKEEYWLVSMNPDEPENVLFAEGNIPVWYIHIQGQDNVKRRVLIDMAPMSTYHISAFDTEDMFATLFHMIQDGIIRETFVAEY